MAPRTLVLIPPSEGKAEGGDGPPWAAGTMAVDGLDPMRRKLGRALGAKDPAPGAHDGRHRALHGRAVQGARRRLLRPRPASAGALDAGRVGALGPGGAGRSDPALQAQDERVGAAAREARPGGARSSPLRSPLVRRLVWDLLPIEHSAAVAWGELAPAEQVTVRFEDARGATVSHWNKLLKGSLVRWLAETGATQVEALEAFEHPQG
ncbi:MAG: peroxide stress protein YaaA [Acidimicrobiales bacterium]